MSNLDVIEKNARENHVPVMLEDGMEFLVQYIREHEEIVNILEIGTAVGKVNAVSREEIEQVEKELDAVLEMVQRPVTVKNADNREEAASLQENLQESSQEKSQKNLQERSQESEPVQIEIKKEKKKAGSLGKAKEQTAAAREEKVDAVHKAGADE